MTRYALLAAPLFALLLAALTLVVAPSLIEANSPPDNPSSVTLTRADGTITVSGYSVSSATKYHITYSSNGGASWAAAAVPDDNYSASSVTFSADNAKTYIVGVRAGNDDGWSGWKNSPAVGPYTPPDTSPAPPPPPAPSTPGAISVTRADGTLTASWDAVAHAVNYHITYSSNGGASWGLAAFAHTQSGITISADNAKTYIIGVRAYNDSGSSAWRNSPAAGPFTPPTPTPTPTPEPVTPPAAPTGLTAAASDGSVILSWDDPDDDSLSGYQYKVNHNDTSSGNLTGWGAWQRIAGGGADTTSHSISGLTNGREYRYRLRALNSGGAGGVAPSAQPWFVSASPQPPSLTVQDATDTSITLALDNYGGQWYYRQDSASGGGAGGAAGASTQSSQQCTGPIEGEANITGLDPNSQYTYGAYGNSNCSQGIASAAANTLPTPPGKVGKPSGTPKDGGFDASWSTPTGTTTTYQGEYRPCVATWSTGCGTDGWPDWGIYKTWFRGRPSGTSATVSGLPNGVLFQARVRAGNANQHGTSWGAWSEPSDNILTNPQPYLTTSQVTGTSARLTMGNYYQDWWYKADIAPHTTCTPVGGSRYTGGSYANLTGLTEHTTYTYTAYDSSSCGATNELTSLTFAPSADELNASNITATTATITITGHTQAWYYKANHAPDDSCKGPVTAGTNSKTLTGLTPGTEYTYNAYDSNDSGCAGTSIAEATFTTGGVSVSNLSRNQTFVCHVGTLSGSISNCAISFTAGSEANGYTLHSITLRFGGGTATKPTGFAIDLHKPDTTDSSKPGNVVPNTTLNGSTPTGAGTYTYTCAGTGCRLGQNATYFVAVTSTQTTGTRYYEWKSVNWTGEDKIPSSNGWSIADEYRLGNNWSVNSVGYATNMKIAATVNPAHTTLTASSISGTGATLAVNDTGAWSYKGVSGTSASTSCVTVSSGTTDTLSGLTADKLYGYTAYNGSGCTGTEFATEYFSTNDYDVGNLSETDASGFNCNVGYTNSETSRCAVAFTTGSRSGGYTLKSVSGRFGVKDGTPGSIVVAIHAADTTNSANPAATAIANATFTGSDPDTAGLHTFACSGAGCSLSASTTYFVVMSTGDTSGISAKYYKWRNTTSGAEAGHPSAHGWSIANAARYNNGSGWTDLNPSRTGALHIAADD